MKSFLLKGKKPIIKWGQLPNNTFFKGEVPEGYSLAVSPWGYDNYIVVDVDKHKDLNGFDNIPEIILEELMHTFHYKTKNDGMHFWFKYTGNDYLANKASGLGIDLRTNKGYVVWYPDVDVRDCIDKFNKTSETLNEWLVELFGYKKT